MKSLRACSFSPKTFPYSKSASSANRMLRGGNFSGLLRLEGTVVGWG